MDAARGKTNGLLEYTPASLKLLSQQYVTAALGDMLSLATISDTDTRFGEQLKGINYRTMTIYNGCTFYTPLTWRAKAIPFPIGNGRTKQKKNLQTEQNKSTIKLRAQEVSVCVCVYVWRTPSKMNEKKNANQV